MFRSSSSALALLALSAPVLLTGAGRSTKPAAKATVELKQQASSRMAGLPISFEPNRGQTDPSVSYLANIGNTRLFLTRDSAVFAIQKGQSQRGTKQELAVVRMRTVNTQRAYDQATERLPGVSNYLIGQDSAKWVTGVPQFGKVNRQGVYPGIDMVFYGNQRQLEYDFVLAPGADPNRIELAFDGVDSIRLSGAGDLVLATSAGELIQKKPKVYQQLNGKQVEVAANYRIGGRKTVRFEVARYDRSKALVIDPYIVFNAIIGSSDNDSGLGVAIDASSNTYVTGTATAPDFPLVNALQSSFQGSNKIFVLKLNPTGSALVYSTYLGGEGNDYGQAIGVDSSGNAIVTGTTSSLQYPVVAAAQGSFGGGPYDGIVSKLSSSGGALLYSTYLGGTGIDQMQGLTVDPNGYAYVVGFTSGGFPATGGSMQPAYAGGGSDCMVAKYTPGGAISYATYLGGSNSDSCVSVAADVTGAAYVAGYTYSNDFPKTNGAAQIQYAGLGDAFVTKINPQGSAIVYSTYFGGEGVDAPAAITIDSQGAAYITGSTQSTQLPLTSGAFQTVNRGSAAAFVAKIAPSGGPFSYATLIGGRKADTGYGIAVDSSFNAYVVGSTTSDNFPVTNAVIVNKPGVNGVIVKSSNGGVSFSAADTGIPNTLANGITINSGSGILITPSNGTLYESNNAGLSWVNAQLGNIAGVATAANNPGAMYAYGPNTSALFKSTDGGANWIPKTPSQSFTVANMAVSPTQTATLLAASSNGMWLSSDSGQTWAQSGNTPWSFVTFLGDVNSAVACTPSAAGVYRTSTGPGSFALSNAGISSSSICTRVIVDPNNSSVVYLTATDGLYKSVNGGSSWSLASNLPLVSPSVAVAPSNSNIVVAGGRNGGFYRSVDAGATWTASADLTTTPINGVAVSPTDFNTIYVALDMSTETVGFAAMVNPTGTALTYSTFLGAPGGTSKQYARNVAVDSSGNAYIVGQSASPFYHNTPGALNLGYGGWDIFMTKLSPASFACLLSFGQSTLVPDGTGGKYPIEIFAPSGCAWSASPNASWVSLSGPANATGSVATTVVVASNPGSARSTTVGFTTGQAITINQGPGGCLYTFSPNSGSVPAGGGSGTAPVSASSGCTWNANSNEFWLSLSSASGSGSGQINYTATANNTSSARSAVITVGTGTFTVNQPSSTVTLSGLQFYPITPCRVADTRTAAGFAGAFGPPSMSAGSQRSFPIPSSACGIPSTAAAYSFNFTVVPLGARLGVLTTWPTGQTIPNASTLNSYNGTVVANAAIVPAGTGGAISVYASDATEVLFDINGYFAPPLSSGLQFYPITPCRIADTRTAAGFTGSFGPPTMAAGTQRSFAVPSSACGIPSNASAYSLNFTVVPTGARLGYMTTWPTGSAIPNASTLNSYNGSVVANAAIVPAGTGGAISVFVTDSTDVLFDINGYFAPQSGSGLQFYPVTPCRIADTRAAAGFAGAFGPPSMGANAQRSFPVPSSSCSIPSNASAYSFNFTVVPPAPLGFLTTWPTGSSIPNASTLNSYLGLVVANAAIVPAGTSGAISVFVNGATDVLFDINGYFAH